MTPRLKRVFVVLLVTAVLAPSVSMANRTRLLSPKSDYTESELSMYWAGVFSQIGMRLCGYYTKGKKLKNLVEKYEPAKYGIKQWMRAVSYGGSCAEATSYIDKFLIAFEGSSNASNSDSYASQDDKRLCNFAVSGPNNPVCETRPKYLPAVEEAKSRDLTPIACAELWN